MMKFQIDLNLLISLLTHLNNPSPLHIKQSAVKDFLYINDDYYSSCSQWIYYQLDNQTAEVYGDLWSDCLKSLLSLSGPDKDFKLFMAENDHFRKNISDSCQL